MTLGLCVRVHYDFASTICYVAHRIMHRLADDLDGLGIDLEWSPLDLSRMLQRPRGEPLHPAARRNADRVARELGVPVQVPARWIDSRELLAGALLAEQAGRGGEYRDCVWRGVYEGPARGPALRADRVLAEELGLPVAAGALAAALEAVEARTREAARASVTGVPTFMLGDWPFGGIQDEATMRAILARFAARTLGV